jgi:23S rRNA pseudouridine1911/1915/1917 synthase
MHGEGRFALTGTAGDERPGVVHRLDKGTSGVMVLDKNQEALDRLQREFKNRNVKKTYISLVRGVIQPPEGVINMPISRDTTKKERMTVSKEGKEAATNFRTLQNINNKLSLLELNPKTGRTHQIRVHLSALGYPIIGDFKYGPKERIQLSRIFLHAQRLEFRHPVTEKMLTFEAKLPKELEAFLATLD